MWTEPLYTAEEMRAAEEAYDGPMIELMERAGSAAAEAVMVGDDVEADIGGAKAIGMRGVLVRTGKFRPAALEEAEPQPDAVVDSIADLPAYLNGA